MARLHLLRNGTGDARVASSFEVAVNDVMRSYGRTRTHFTHTLPIINPEDGPARDVADPQIAVIELLRGETAFGDFRSPGFHLLVDVDPLDAHNKLVRNVP